VHPRATAALALVALSVGAACDSSPTAGSADPARTTPSAVELLGHSVDGRPLVARVVGDRSAPVRILVVGCIHGDEPAGEAVTRALRRAAAPSSAALWLVDEFNPDGCRRGTRQNARGVDLNRNAPWRWRRLDRPGGTYYSGTRPLSEPESRAINLLVTRIRPTVSIWYHQHARLVDSSSGGSRVLEQRYARTVGLPLRAYGLRPGSITDWQDHAFPGTTAFVVELPAGVLRTAAVNAHVRGVLALAQAVAGPPPSVP
jgi:protein MpaA